MKTISDCFLYIAIMCPLELAEIYFCVTNLADGCYWLAIFDFFVCAVGIWAILCIYKTAKAIEQTMRPRIEVKIIIKDKDDEVEADK